jgi:hypothetical protein
MAGDAGTAGCTSGQQLQTLGWSLSDKKNWQYDPQKIQDRLGLNFRMSVLFIWKILVH